MKCVSLKSCSSFVKHLVEFPSTQYSLVEPTIYNGENITASIREVVTVQHRKRRVSCPEGSVSKLSNIVVNPNGSLLDSSGTAIKESVEDFLESMGAEETTLRAPKQESGIVLFKYGYQNYGHWLIEMLPKLHFLKDIIKQNPQSKILIGNVSGGVRNIVYSTLEHFGVPRDSLLPIEQSTEFDELFYCTPITMHPYMMRPEIRVFYQQLRHSETKPRDKLFVTRPPGATRTIKTLESIEAYFADNGYKVVEPASLPFLEQVEIFKQAKEVAGIAGAAMTNTIFCAEGTEVLHIVPPSMPNLFFYQLASICDHSYSEFRGTADHGDMFGKQFEVNLDDLRIVIEHSNASISS